MPIIQLETMINADQNIVFDLSRSIDLHQISTAQTSEQAVGGKVTGLIDLGESVTWQAKHFGVVQRLTSKITEMKSPDYFVDEMVSGAFKSFRHEHFFKQNRRGTLMIDIFKYVSPFGILGRFADNLFLRKYMIKLLEKRNEIIKYYAEKNKHIL